jgi:hypothetical protein
VSTGGARRGRRDNGLDAADFAAAGDVDPRVGEHLLDVLALEGIAAYLQPSADQNPILRATTLPSRPTDRLFVDRTHLADARATMTRLTGTAGAVSAEPVDDRPGAGGSQSEVDAEWARIIAGFHSTAEPTWPSAESLDTARPAPTMPSATDITNITLNRRRTDPPPPPPEAFDDLDDSDEDEERYIPPPPPPLPHISKYAIAGIIGIIGGFILFLRPSLLPIDRDFVTLIGFSAVIGGAVTLVWRLRSGDEDDDFDDDDGAVV